MKIVLDEMMPEELATLLPGHQVDHVIHLGWRHVVNGQLLTLCETSGFEVFVTKDGNLPYQQNLKRRQIAIKVLRSRNQSLPSLLALAPQVMAILHQTQPGMVMKIG